MSQEKPIKLVSFDFDGTLILENSWRVFHKACNITEEEDQKYHDLYNSKKITYNEWADILSDMWKERVVITRDFAKSVSGTFHLREGAREIVSYLKDKGYRIIVTTGAMDVLVQPVIEELGIETLVTITGARFDESGTYLGVDNKTKSERGGEAKGEAFRQFLLREGIDASTCAHIGDGENDLSVFEMVGKPIALDSEYLKEYHPKYKIRDFSEIKSIL